VDELPQAFSTTVSKMSSTEAALTARFFVDPMANTSSLLCFGNNDDYVQEQ
jgi:hypothetical protein